MLRAMTDLEFEVLVRSRESERLELKSSIADAEKIREAICAFANDLPGHGNAGAVVVGLDDDGRCSHVPITDQLLRTLADMRSDGNILPFPTLSVQRRVVAGCEVAAIIVQPSVALPVRLRGRTWIRVGPRRGTATAEEERRLVERARSRNVPFDIRLCPGAAIDDLEMDLFRRTYLPSAIASEVLTENRRSELEQLASLRLAALDGTPTVLGVLLFARDPTSLVPGAYVQFLRIDGRELADPIKAEKRLHGPMLDQLRMLDDLIRAHVETSVDVTTSPIEERRPDYPVVALDQLVRNAVLHRDYEGSNAPVRIYWFNDRVEVHSPGGPYGQVTIENFGQPGVTDYRNPHVAEALKYMGYVQKFGVGIPTAQRELDQNNSPPAEFLPTPTYVVSIVRRRR
jgi:ATP-dependent DNA helicase RecG